MSEIIDYTLAVLPALISGINENISGQIVDTNGKPVPGRIYVTSYDGGQTIAGPFDTDNLGKFNFQASVSDTDLLKIDAPGFDTPLPFAMEYTYPDNPYYLQVQKKSNLLPIALGAGLILLSMKKKKKVSGITVGDVIPFFYIAGGLIVLNKGNQLLEWLGLSPKKSTMNLDITSSDPNSFWNVNFWTKAPNGTYSYAISEAQAQTIIGQLQDAFGYFDDDESAAIAALQQLRTQANLSFVAWEFNKTEGKDLLSWLRGDAWPNDRLSDDEVYQIHNYFAQLPKY